MPARRGSDAPLAHDPRTLDALNAIIAEAGPLVPGATQAVFGEGTENTEVVFVR